jgi:hypothetical protein
MGADTTEDRDRVVAGMRRRILALLSELEPAERRQLVSALRLDVADEGDAPSVKQVNLPASQQATSKAYAETAGSLVRKVFADATEWLTTAEVVAEVHKTDPKIDPRRVYATINKMANKGKKKLARHGEAPSIRYATLEHASAWGEAQTTARTRLNGSAAHKKDHA